MARPGRSYALGAPVGRILLGSGSGASCPRHTAHTSFHTRGSSHSMPTMLQGRIDPFPHGHSLPVVIISSTCSFVTMRWQPLQRYVKKMLSVFMRLPFVKCLHPLKEAEP